MPARRPLRIILFFLLTGSWILWNGGPVLAQGCCTVSSAPSIPVGDERSATLKPLQAILNYHWSYFEADENFFHDLHLLDTDSVEQMINVQNEHTAGIELGLVEKLSLIVEVPFHYNRRDFNNPDFGRIHQTAAGLGDLRTYLRYWCLPDHLLPGNGNLAFEAGVKIPTGDDSIYTDQNGTRLPADISIQTGTGSWDGIFGAAMFMRFGPVVPFANARYLLAPATDTGLPALDPLLAGQTIYNSIPDQAIWKVGASLDVGRLVREQFSEKEGGSADRVKVSLGFEGRHVPRHDLIGSSAGFRRAFDAYFLEPGFEWWITDRFGINGSFPVTVYRYLSTNPGTFPDLQVNLGLSFLLN
jgi:hypothetical protein